MICSYYSFRASTGKERDAEMGLDFFGARYYSGARGRFTSPDRVIVTPARMEDPQRFNLYAYARNNPFKFIALKYRVGHQNLLHNPDLDSRTVIKIENEIRAVHGMNPRTGADHGQTVITVNGKVQ